MPKKFSWKWLIIGGLALILGMLIVGTGIITANASSGPGTTPTPGVGTGRPGKGPGHGPKAVLTVTSINGQKITAKRLDGTTVTIVTTSSTVYTRAGMPVNASAITTGKNIHVRGTMNSDGSITAVQVDIVLPGYHGLVTAVNGSTITVQDRSGTKRTIKVSSSTSFLRAGQAISLSDIKSGEQVGAAGTLNSDGSLNAEVVHIDLPHVGGQVTKISGSTITTSDRHGTHTIQVSSSTVFMNDQTQQRISLSSLKVGDNIHAEGTLNSDGSLAALIVHLGPQAPTK